MCFSVSPDIIETIGNTIKGDWMFKKIRSFVKNYRILALVIIIFAAGIVLELTGLHTAARWLLSVSALIAALPLAWGMIETLRAGEFGVDLLALTAIVTSVILGEYWAGMIIVLMLTGGEALEDYAESRAKSEITDLIKRKPRKAHLLKSGKTIDVKVDSVKVSDKLVILPGEVVPVDCEVIEGSSSFDESSLTGESLPVIKSVGQTLLSGSINTDGAVTVKALHSAEDSQYEQIIKLVQSAAASKAPFVRMADRYSIPFTAIAFLIAGTAWVLSGDPVRFLEVIVVATPCPLLLGAPIALVSGMSRAAKHGVIVKTGSALERLAEVQTVAFDKTGTLTQGQPVIEKIRTVGAHKSDQLLMYAASLSSSSNHVLSTAITTAAGEKNLKLQKAKQIQEISGKGVIGRVQGKTVTLGRLTLLQDSNIAIPKGFKLAEQTASYVAVNDELIGCITFVDPIRTESKTMLQKLKTLGIKHTLMVTGDNSVTAKKIAKQLGIEQVKADCLPADKIHAIEGVEHRPVAFVGDGVNDAPVLTAADVGIALGARGSTAASESADIVIMLDDVSKVASSVHIAKRTFSIARQAILIGISISVVLMLVFSTGRFKAVQGAAIQEVVDIIVILYALRAHGSFRKKSVN